MKACPSCKSDSIIVTKCGKDLWTAYCNSCGTKEVMDDTKERAISKWDKMCLEHPIKAEGCPFEKNRTFCKEKDFLDPASNVCEHPDYVTSYGRPQQCKLVGMKLEIVN